ncbi:unnamed protein product [Symbiodinium microadriaticum]|nr:unnamed protein product [Symbiodinium microadriaticum]
MAETLTGIAGGLLGGAAAFTTANWDVVGMTSGLATSGRGAQVDQSFQRKHDRIDYKVQRQSLHRDDLNDLMGLTIGRMDMYNLVGALLLTFALQWITSSDIVAAPDVKYWPPWYSTVFVISCFSSVGYLLFSLWFAMMCSVTCQSLGTRLRINFARLSLPKNEDISRIKVPFFIPGGALEKMQNKIFHAEGEAEHREFTGQELLRELKKEELEADSASSPTSKPEKVARGLTFNDWGSDNGEKDDDDQDFEKHLRRWLYERGQWLSADAYARACMVVGMNQMLQALTYHVVATVWKVSALTSIACLLLAKSLSLFMLQVDLGIRKYRCFGFTMVMLLELLPPTYATLYLFVYVPGIEWPGWLQGVACFPVFLLHAVWMGYLSHQLTPASGTGDHPAFDTETHLSDSDSSSSGSEQVDEDLARRRLQSGRGFYGTDFLPHRLKRNKLFNIIELQDPIPENELREAKVDPMPGKVTVNFTFFLAVLYILSGIMHMAGQIFGFDQAAIIDCSDDNCTTSGSNPIWPHARPRPRGPSARHHPLRRLRGQYAIDAEMGEIQSNWPSPASFFEVKALHCSANNSHLFMHNGFAAFEAEVLNKRLGELKRLEMPQVESVMFCKIGACFALLPGPVPTSPWSLRLLSAAASSELNDQHVQNVSVPETWRLVSAVWAESGLVWLAGWDGSSIIAAKLWRGSPGRPWHLEQSFKVRPGAGLCHAGKETCSRHVAGGYIDVQALQLSAEGKSLVVLHGGHFLDSWDLEIGAFKGQLQLEQAYQAMCHNDASLHLVRHSPAGPILEELPWARASSCFN